jgi:sulfate/thiosulfate-binding protein
LEGQDRSGRNSQCVQWRLGQAGACRDRRLEADVVTLGLAYDIDAIAEKAQLLPADWQSRLPDNSTPYTSTIVFLVRKGNPKGIKDWPDLVKPGIQVITPESEDFGRRTMGLPGGVGLRVAGPGRRARRRAKDFVMKLYKNVPVLDSGARGSTTTFVERGIGDVLLAWENEAYLALNQFGKDKFEIVYPSTSVLAEPPVALVETRLSIVAARGQWLEEYLEYLYSAGGAGDRRRALLPPAAGVGGEIWTGLSQAEALHRAGRLRRMAKGAGDSFCRRRRVRPDLSAISLNLARRN